MGAFSDAEEFSLKAKEMQEENEWARHYTELHLRTYFSKMMYRDLAREADRVFSDRVLELGCGTGILLCMIRRRDKHGVDLSPMMLRYCSRTVARVCADIDYLPFRSRCFRNVLIHSVLHHRRNILAAFRELRRILVDDAVVLVQEPSAVSNLGYLLPNRLLLKFFVLIGYTKYQNVDVLRELPSLTTHRLFEMRELLQAARDSGFKVWRKRYLYNTSFVLSTLKGKLPIFLGRLLEVVLSSQGGYVIRILMKPVHKMQ